MASLYPITVKTGGGGDYTSLATAASTEAGTHGNLVGNDQYIVFTCSLNGGSADTSEVTFANWTTDATHYVEVIGPVTSTPGVWNASYYTLEVANLNCIYATSIGHLRLTNLQLYCNAGSATKKAVNLSVTVAGVFYVRSCIMKYSGTATTITRGVEWYRTSNDSTLYVYNNVIYDFKGPSNNGEGIGLRQNVTAYLWNNTVYGCGYGSRIGATGTTVEAFNELHYGNVTADYNGVHDTGGYNCSDDGTEPGSYGLNLSADPFVSIGSDFHLSAAISQAGYDLSAYFTADIDGNTRSHWDAGADEYAGATIHSAQCSMTASGSVTAAASAIRPAASSITGSGTLTTVASAIRPGISAMTGSGTVTAAATAIRSAACSMTGSGSLMASATVIRSAASSMTGSGVVTAAAGAVRPAVVAMTGSGTLTASATLITTAKAASCAMTGSATLTVTVTVIRTASATLTGFSTLTASATLITTAKAASCAMTGSATLTVTVTVIRTASATLTGSGVVTAAAGALRPAAATMTATGVLTAAATIYIAVPAVITFTNFTVAIAELSSVEVSIGKLANVDVRTAQLADVGIQGY